MKLQITFTDPGSSAILQSLDNAGTLHCFPDLIIESYKC